MAATANTAPSRSNGLLLIAAIVATSGLLHFSGLSEIPFHTKGEPREALAVQDLLHGDGTVLPMRNAYEMPRKPPLFYWLGGAVGLATGTVDEATVRLPSALQSCAAALLLLFACWARGKRKLGFFAALVLLTSFEWSRAATSARIDMTLALGTTASFVGLTLLDQRQRRLGLLLLYLGMIWGTLAKGPIGILLPSLCMAVLALVEAGRSWLIAAAIVAVATATAIYFQAPPAWIGSAVLLASAVIASGLGAAALARFAPIPGYAAVAIAVGTWYALAAQQGGAEFVELQIIAENFGRFFGTAPIAVGHLHGPWYLVGALAAGLLPWTLFLPGMLLRSMRRGQPDGTGPGALRLHALVWVGVVFGFFQLSSSKRGVYLLPLYPAASLLMATWIVDLVESTADRALLQRVAVPIALAAAFVGGTLASLFALQAAGGDILGTWVAALAGDIQAVNVVLESLGERAPLLSLLFAAAATCAVFVSIQAARARWPGFVAAWFALLFFILLAVQRAVMPAVAAANTRQADATLLRTAAIDRGVVVAPSFDYGLTYYLGGAVPVVDPARCEPGDALTVLPLGYWRQLPARVRQQYEPVPSLRMAKRNNQAAQITVQRRSE